MGIDEVTDSVDQRHAIGWPRNVAELPAGTRLEPSRPTSAAVRSSPIMA